MAWSRQPNRAALLPPDRIQLASALFVNTVAPEAAAEKWRAVQLD